MGNGTHGESSIDVDIGYYQCRASNDAGEALSDVTHVTIYSTDESQWSAPTETVISGVVGDSVVLPFCSVTGNVPKWRAQWRNCDDEELTPDENFIITDNGDLVILNLRPESEKCYTSKFYFYELQTRIKCASETQLNIRTGDSHATRLVYKSKNKTTLEGHSATLMCVFSGRIRSAITWSRKSGRTVRGLVSEFGRKLVLAAVREDDEDEYVCSADEATESILLNVVVRPRITTPLLSQNVTSGQSVDFTCNVTSKPNSWVTWFINGIKVQSGVSVAREYKDHNSPADGLFSIKLVAVRRSFSISCNVSNEYGYDFSSASVGLQIVSSISPTTTLGITAEALGGATGLRTSSLLGGTPTSPTAAEASLLIIICVVASVVVATIAVCLLIVACCRRRRRRKGRQQHNKTEDKTAEHQEDDIMLDKPPPDVERASLASEHHSNLSGVSSQFSSTDSGIDALQPDESSAMAENIENMARDQKLLAAEEDVDG